MKIYTRTGDDGTTSLFGGRRVNKHDLQIESYGTVDELNACIGLLLAHLQPSSTTEFLLGVQDRLFAIGANLAVEPGNEKVKVPPLAESDVSAVEHTIDALEQELEPLRSFILPGGNVPVALCHVVRTVCRRAERNVVALAGRQSVDVLIVHYLNRLSDYFFVLARTLAREGGVRERPWKPGDGPSA